MGGKSTSETQTSSQTSPWAPAQESLTGILGKLNPLVQNSGLSANSTNAINQLEQNAQGGNQYSGDINSYVQSLFGGGGGANAQAGNIQSGLDTYRQQLTPFANGSMVGNNPALKAQLDQIYSDVGNNVNSQFAAAGRDMSGANQQAYGRGVASGVAPVLANQYNQDVSNQLGAAGSLYGAQNQTSGLLAGLNQQSIANRGAGLDASQQALAAQNYGPTQMLNLEQLRQQLPAQNLGLLAQIGVPIAGLGSQSSGTSNTTNQASGATQFSQIAGGLGGIGKFLWG